MPEQHRMTLGEYMTNPYGKGDFTTNRNVIKADLEMRLKKIMEREKNPFHYTVYSNGKAKSYLIHVKLPSETVKKNMYYDVCFFLDNLEEGIANANLSVFSNNPSFTYTYAYVFNKNDMVIGPLKTKYDKKVLTLPPSERNRYERIGWEKSIFFALFYLKEQGILELDKLQEIAKDIDKKKFVDEISSADDKKEERVYKFKLQRAEEKRLKEKENSKKVEAKKEPRKVPQTTTTKTNHIIPITGKEKIRGRKPIGKR